LVFNVEFHLGNVLLVSNQVGQFGVQLSGGQKQRIAIARALIRDPRILLLDEATSALDEGSERIVQGALDQASKGRTTIIVAHRLSTILKADLIVVLQSGRVVESGSHDKLMRVNNGKGGAYSKMVHLQQPSMQNEGFSSPYHQREHTYHWKQISPRTPQTPLISVRSSWQSSPAYPISSAFSIDLTHTFQMQPYDYHNDEKLEKNDYPPDPQWRLVKMSAPEWKQALLGCLGAACNGTIHPIQAYCLGTVISVYFINDKSVIKSEIRVSCCIFLSLAVLSFIANLLQHCNFAIMGESLTKRVREKMLEKLLTFEVGWFDKDDNTSAAICARLATEANMVRSLIVERMSLLVQVFFSACLAFIVGLVVAWRVAIVMIAMQPLLIASFYSKSVLMKKLSGKAKTAQSQGSQLASEATINHRTITAFCSQERTLSLFEAAMRGPRKESVKQSWFLGLGLFFSQFLTTATIALTYWYGGRLVNQKLVTPKHLFQVFFLLISTGKNIADAGSMTSDIAKGGSAIRSVLAIIDRKSEIEPEDHNGIKVKKTFEGCIELKKVFFSYPARPDQTIFKGLSLKIEGGKTIALVGQSGSGKSTIVGLIERFYDPQNGSILIDERDIKSYNLRKLRSHIALVSQEPTLFGGTIRENIVYGKEDATESEVRKAARLANAHEFIWYASLLFILLRKQVT